MKAISRAVVVGAIVLLAAGPLGVAAAPVRSSALVAQAATSISGTIKDDTGAPVSGAHVELRGPQQYSTDTDSSGAFSLSSVAPGIYVLAITKPGFSSATESDFVVVEGEPQTVNTTLVRATLSSLRTIATVQTRGSSFNTTPASVNVITSQAFIDQAQPQVQRVLSQVPGVQISFPDSSANAAAPGAITFPNIRNAASYETASLIDGHPVGGVGGYGDYVSTFLQSFLFKSTEIVKGPGADATQVNNAIGGTINFRTLDPTSTPDAFVELGADSHGGTYSNLKFSDTLGHLGFVVAIANLDEPSALNGTRVWFDPTAPNPGFLSNSGANQLGYSYPGSTQVANTSSFTQTQYPLLACCYTFTGNFDNTGELLKFRYAFSGSTTATVSYLGGQAYSDQNGNVGNVTMGTFAPSDGAGHGTLANGAVVPVDYVYAGGANEETNNEPILQAEVSTTLGNDTLIARYYHASLNRLAYEGSQPGNLDTQNFNVYGVSSGNPAFYFNGTLNGQSTPVSFYDYFRETESDKVGGYSFEYLHPLASGDVSLSVDQSNDQALDYEQEQSFGSPFFSVTLPTGSNEVNTTYLLRGHFMFGDKLKLTLSDYQNEYRYNYPVSCPFSGQFNDCDPNGANVTFTGSSTSHNDPRLGLVYLPKDNLAIRFAAGSSIAPPYLGLLNQISGGQGNQTGPASAVVTVNSGQLKPETAFGYDLGADYQLKDQATSVSTDIYQTNLFNHYFQETTDAGFTCAAYGPGCYQFGNPVANPSAVEVYYGYNTNLSNARFEGIELSIKHHPQVGFGWDVEGSTQRGYVYNLPSNFYCSFKPTTAQPCVPANYDQNLNIIAGANLSGEGQATSGATSNISGLNQSVPYLQGNVDLSYTTKNGALAMFGETLYGKNNSLNEPPFGIAYATLRYPLTKVLSLQVSGDNILNAWTGLYPLYVGGVAIPLANGTTAATTGNVLGPATYRFVLTAKLPE